MSTVASTHQTQAVTDAVLDAETKRLYDGFRRVESVAPSAYVIVPPMGGVEGTDFPFTSSVVTFTYFINGEAQPEFDPYRAPRAPRRITDPQEALKVLRKTVDLALETFADARDVLYVRRPLSVEADFDYESDETVYVVRLRCVGVKL